MKKILLLLTVMLASVGIASASDSYTRDTNLLPAPARQVIENSFNAGVSVIKIDKTLGKVKEYDVVLSDGTEIEFDRNGNWKSVEVSAHKSVPAAIVPSAITTYVRQNQHGTKIVGIEKERNGYEVTLSNGLDLKFDRNGNFIRFD